MYPSGDFFSVYSTVWKLLQISCLDKLFANQLNYSFDDLQLLQAAELVGSIGELIPSIGKLVGSIDGNEQVPSWKHTLCKYSRFYTAKKQR